MLVYLRSTRAVVGFVSRKLDDFHDKPTVVVRWEYVYLTLKEHLGIAERVDVIAVCPIEYIHIVHSFIHLAFSCKHGTKPIGPHYQDNKCRKDTMSALQLRNGL